MTFQAGTKIDEKEAEEKERDADGGGEKGNSPCGISG